MILLLLAALLLAGYGFARITGLYKPRTYEAVLHEEKVRYIPRKQKLQAPLEEFPTRPPRAGEHITPHGELVSID